MGLFKIFITIVVLFLIVSCSGKSPPTYINNKTSYSCNMICIGEKEFENNSGFFHDFDASNSTRVKWAWHNNILPNYCLLEQYTWDAINQVELDNGQKICSASIDHNINYGGSRFNKNNGLSIGWCDNYDKNLSEKNNILNSLNACEKNYEENGQERLNAAYPITEGSSNIITKEENDRRENENKAIQTCKNLGFIKTESIAECSLKIINSQNKIIIQNSNNSETLAEQIRLNNNLKIMQLGLKLIAPPQPKLFCQQTLFGVQCF